MMLAFLPVPGFVAARHPTDEAAQVTHVILQALRDQIPLNALRQDWKDAVIETANLLNEKKQPTDKLWTDARVYGWLYRHWVRRAYPSQTPAGRSMVHSLSRGCVRITRRNIGP
jgi:hypothetical protein